MWIQLTRLALFLAAVWTSPEAEGWREYQQEVERTRRKFEEADREFMRDFNLRHPPEILPRMPKKDKP